MCYLIYCLPFGKYVLFCTPLQHQNVRHTELSTIPSMPFFWLSFLLNVLFPWLAFSWFHFFLIVPSILSFFMYVLSPNCPFFWLSFPDCPFFWLSHFLSIHSFDFRFSWLSFLWTALSPVCSFPWLTFSWLSFFLRVPSRLFFSWLSFLLNFLSPTVLSSDCFFSDYPFFWLSFLLTVFFLIAHSSDCYFSWSSLLLTVLSPAFDFLSPDYPLSECSFTWLTFSWLSFFLTVLSRLSLFGCPFYDCPFYWIPNFPFFWLSLTVLSPNCLFSWLSLLLIVLPPNLPLTCLFFFIWNDLFFFWLSLSYLSCPVSLSMAANSPLSNIPSSGTCCKDNAQS